MRPAVILLLGLLAAPIWAPSSAYAAKTNTLSAASVTPLVGTPDTIFSFAVSYSGGSAYPAEAVWADVAGSSISLTLVAGTPGQGTWAGSSHLPAGTWSVTFVASPMKGSKSTLAGPTVVVVGATVAPSGGPSGGAADGGWGGTSSPVAAPSGAVSTPSPGPGTTTATPPGTPSLEAAPGSPTPNAGSTDVQDTPGQTGSGAVAAASTKPAPRPSGVSQGGGSASARPGPASSIRASAGSSSAFSRTSDPLGLGDPAASLRATIVLAGAALLSLLALLLARRRRRHAEAMVRPGTAAAVPPKAEPDLTPRTRAAARTRIAPGDDPILRAMGLDPDAPAAAGASQLRARARRINQRPPAEPKSGEPPQSGVRGRRRRS